MKNPIIHLLVAGALFVCVLLGYVGAYTLLTNASLKDTDLAKRLVEKTENASAVAEASTLLANVSAEQANVDRYLVSSREIVPFLEQFQRTGKILGSVVTVVSVSENASPRPHLNLALKVEGSFEGVLHTVGAIEYAPYDITVTTLTLSTSAGPDVAPWSAAMALSVGAKATSTPATAGGSATTTKQ
ncbi:MAG: hypothetical protein WAV21_02525 [Minisyncoccia bacterium]